MVTGHTSSKLLLYSVMIFAIIMGSIFSCPLRSDAQDWVKFGLVFQNVKETANGAKTFWFYWGNQKTAFKLCQANGKGVYLPAYNLVRTCEVFSKIKAGPDYELITTKHPEWLMRYKNGSPLLAGMQDFIGPRLDLANPDYVSYAVNWLKLQVFSGNQPVRDVGLDNGMFMYADKRWAKYDTNEAYQDAWEYFLRRISEALRPQHKVILNVGGCDLPTFTRMIRWVDGVLHEDLCVPPHDSGYSPKKVRKEIQDRWQKGQWCAENGKVWAVRYRGTISALKLEPSAGSQQVSISMGDREIVIFGPGKKVIGRLNFSSPEADTLARLAAALNKLSLKATILNPYPETATLGTLQPIILTKVKYPLTLKLKQAPREAFLFGYAAVMMAAGPNSYFILGDERNQEYYYPEMDWSVGVPLGPKREVKSQVFRRDFQRFAAFLNLSDSAFQMPNGNFLPPMRGAIMKSLK